MKSSFWLQLTMQLIKESSRDNLAEHLGLSLICFKLSYTREQALYFKSGRERQGHEKHFTSRGSWLGLQKASEVMAKTSFYATCDAEASVFCLEYKID